MSLINDMLKDLEARGEREVADVKHVRAPVASANSGVRLLLLSLSALVVVLAAAVAYLGWSGNKPAPATAATTEAQAEPVVAEMPVVVAETETADTVEPDEAATAATLPPVEPVVAPVEIKAPEAAPVKAVNAPVETAAAKMEKPAQVAGAATAADEGNEAGKVTVRRHEPTPEQRAQRAGQDGMAALRRGDWATAARLLQEVVEVEPANDDAREGLVVALQRQGRLAEMEGALLDGLAVAAEPARFAKLRARQQAGRGELDAALDTLAIAVPAVDIDPEYHALKAALAQQAGKHEQAAEIYTALIKYAPGNGTWLAGLAIALDQQGEAAAAHDAYTRALQAGGLDRALVAHAQRRLNALTQALENE